MCLATSGESLDRLVSAIKVGIRDLAGFNVSGSSFRSVHGHSFSGVNGHDTDCSPLKVNGNTKGNGYTNGHSLKGNGRHSLSNGINGSNDLNRHENERNSNVADDEDWDNGIQCTNPFGMFYFWHDFSLLIRTLINYLQL